MMRIRAEWCGSMRTGVESVLVRVESAESGQSVRIRAEHQGEGKLLPCSPKHWQNPLFLIPHQYPSSRIWMQIIGVTVCASRDRKDVSQIALLGCSLDVDHRLGWNDYDEGDAVGGRRR